MLYCLGQLLLVAALAATCVLPQAQATPIDSLQRSTKDNTNKLSRRWFFGGWGGTLAPTPQRNAVPYFVYEKWVIHHDGATHSRIQKSIDVAAVGKPDFVKVSVHKEQSSSGAAI